MVHLFYVPMHEWNSLSSQSLDYAKKGIICESSVGSYITLNNASNCQHVFHRVLHMVMGHFELLTLGMLVSHCYSSVNPGIGFQLRLASYSESN